MQLVPRFALLAAAAALLALASCHTLPPEPQPKPTQPQEPEPPIQPTAARPAPVIEIEPAPSPRPGQFLCIAVRGKTLDAETEALLAQVRPGAVVLMGGNVTNEAQVTALVAAIKKSVGAGLGFAEGPLIAVDQEGGRVNRLRLEDAPSAAELGHSASAEAIRQKARSYARACSRRGIALVLAPVLDLSVPGGNAVVGDRAFGAKPETVLQAGIAFAQGIMAGGCIPVAKHFPGHGGTRADSHQRLAVLEAGGTALERSLAPFYHAGRLGFPAMMTGHIAVAALDPAGLPASLSPNLTAGLLRRQWGYDGLIITDDLNMGAIGIAPGEAAVRALDAGNDMVMYCDPEPARIRHMQAAIAAAIDSGELKREVLVRSAARIERLRAWLKDSRLLRCEPEL